MSELNRTMDRLADEVVAARKETMTNTLAVTELGAQFSVWQRTRCDANMSRIQQLETQERENKGRLDTLSGKGAVVLGLVIIAANLAAALLGVFLG